MGPGIKKLYFNETVLVNFRTSMAHSSKDFVAILPETQASVDYNWLKQPTGLILKVVCPLFQQTSACASTSCALTLILLILRSTASIHRVCVQVPQGREGQLRFDADLNLAPSKPGRYVAVYYGVCDSAAEPVQLVRGIAFALLQVVSADAADIASSSVFVHSIHYFLCNVYGIE